MAIFNLYSCLLLLLLLLALSWNTSTGLPVRGRRSAEECGDCSSLFKSLLVNAKGLLNSDVLCFGITSDKMLVSSTAETVEACAPTLTQNPGCMMQRNSPFNESECLRNIMKDLTHYDAAIQAYLNASLRSPEQEALLLRPTLGIIQSLRKNCSLTLNEENDSLEEHAAQMWGTDSFSNRQEMCKMMRGFYIRTITINRAMGYISSVHRK